MNQAKPTPMRSQAVILIVEDDRSTRALLRLAMAEEGYQVVEAKDGEQGLAEYKNYHPDMVLLDAVMPGMDGFTCCRYLRDLPGGEQIPIMILTVLDDQASVDQAFTAGATDYITKPIHWPVLARRVQRLLAANQAMAAAHQAKQKLYQHQAWMQLMREGLARFNASNDLWGALRATLNDIYQVWGIERVALWQRGTTKGLEMGGQGLLGGSDVSAVEPATDLDFAAGSPWEDQLRTGEVICIQVQAEALGTDAPEPESANWGLTQLKQLGLQVLVVAPISVQGEVWGYLYVGDDQPLAPEDQTAIAHLRDWGQWLGIVIERHQLRMTCLTELRQLPSE